MALTEKYCDPDLTTGLNDGTSEANAWQSIATAFANVAAGERLNMKRTSSPVTLTADISLTNSGTVANPIIVQGYGSTIGDGTRFQIDGATSNYRWSQARDYVVQKDLEHTFASRTPTNNGQHAYLVNCKYEGSTANAPNFTNGASAFGCHLIATGDYIDLGKAGLVGCFIEGGLGVQMTAGFDAAFVIGCVITGSAQYGIKVISASTRGVVVSHNTIYDATDDGIEVSSVGGSTSSNKLIMYNNIVYGCGGYGINNSDSATGTAFGILFNNAYGSNTSGATSGVPDATYGNVTLTADPFVDASSDDFRLNSDSGGGALLRAAGWPSAFPFTGSDNNYVNIGALQHNGSRNRSVFI